MKKMSPRLRELYDDLELYPDERAEIALEIGLELKGEGNREEARDWLHEAIAEGGFDGGVARVHLAEMCLEDGDEATAAAELEVIRKQSFEPLLFEYVADMFEARDHPRSALRWYTMLVARLTDDELEAGAAGMSRLLTPAGHALERRRWLREELGMPPDNLDRMLDRHAERAAGQ